MSTMKARQPAGIPTGGQFAATAHAEADISLAAPDPADVSAEVRTEPTEEPWPGTEFPRQWPRMMSADGRRGTVRTTNGGEVTGTLTSYGTSYAIDVETDEGHLVAIMSWRVAGVRMDDEPTTSQPTSQASSPEDDL